MSTDLEIHLRKLYSLDCLPINHKNYLIQLKNSGFEPKVIYDIGSCVLHWTNFAKTLWPNAEYILFDAFQPAEFLYKENGFKYHIGVLSNKDDQIIKFYQNNYYPTGNSYYREIAYDNGKYFPIDKYLSYKTKTLDSIVNEYNFPYPDFIKIDVQGAEIDIFNVYQATINHVLHSTWSSHNNLRTSFDLSSLFCNTRSAINCHYINTFFVF
jgi:FkbM family methyltransferase